MKKISKQKLLESICTVPNLFWIELSPLERKKWYGTQKINKKLSKNFAIEEKDIENFLTNNLFLIESWLSYSEDRRGGSGYYFIKKGSAYISGYYGSMFRKDQVYIESDNAVKVCSNFICNELNLRLNV